MSSAGSAVALFGDRRSVLVIDLGAVTECPLSPILEVDPAETGHETVAKFLRAFHTPPESSVFYTSSFHSALSAVAERSQSLFTSIIILDDHNVTFSAELLSVRIAALFSSVPSEKCKHLKPSVVLITHHRHMPIPGIDNCFYIPLKPEDLSGLAQLLSETINPSNQTVQAVTCRTIVRDLEENRPKRNPLVEPMWLAEVVSSCYQPIPSHAKFPEIEDNAILEGLRRKMDEWTFFAPSLARPELLNVIILIFERFDLLEILDINISMLKEFVLLVEHNYRDNPYHNFQHAVDVLQCCYYVLNTSMMMRRMFKPVDLFGLLVAALCHDIGHGSFNNTFLMENDSLVAWLYNDRSILENMHATVLFAMLRNPKYNFTSHWPRSQWKEFRSLVMSTILGTDMSQHFDFIRQFTGIDGTFSKSLKILNNGEGGLLPFDDRKLLSIAIIKFADICNVVRPFPIAKKWGFHLMCEFFHQGDWEKALGYQSTPMTTRSVADLAKGQQYFLNNVAGPLYRCMTEYFSELYFVEEHLRLNLENWRNWKSDSDEEIHSFSDLYPLDRDRHHSH